MRSDTVPPWTSPHQRPDGRRLFFRLCASRRLGGAIALTGALPHSAPRSPADEPCDDDDLSPDWNEAGGDGPETGEGIDSLVDQMLARGRFALLLRPQLIGNLKSDQFARPALSKTRCASCRPVQ